MIRCPRGIVFTLFILAPHGYRGKDGWSVSPWASERLSGSAPRVVRAATVAARPRGRGGAGSCAPLWAPPRCAPLQSPAAPGLSRRRAWLGAGWDAGPGCRGVRLSSSGSARTPALAAASTSQLRLRRLCRRAARPPGQELRTLPGGCRQNPDRTSGSLTPPLHLGFPPSSAASLPDQLWPLGRRRL